MVLKTAGLGATLVLTTVVGALKTGLATGAGLKSAEAAPLKTGAAPLKTGATLLKTGAAPL